MLLGARQFFERRGAPLPYDAEVEYLESTGTQWIDTGYRMTSDTMKFECDMMWTSAAPSSANFFYGYRFVASATSTGNMRTFFLYNTNTYVATNFIGKTAIRYGVTGGLSTPTINPNTRYLIAFDGTSLTVDGVEYNKITSASASPAYGNMYLFTCNTGNYYSADISPFVGRIYNFKIWQGDTLVRDFQPVRIGTEGAMYDRLGVGGMNPDGSPRTDGLYRNRGTGAFLYGPDKS